MNEAISKMHIKSIHIENFKCFQGGFDLNFNDGLNILVGDNEAGKSTILEAINLALSGFLSGRYIKNELTQYLFNNVIVDSYVASLEKGVPMPPPHILIELYIEGEGENIAEIDKMEGNMNSRKVKASGVSLNIEFNSKYQKQYQALIKRGGLKTIPIEYYDIDWRFFSQDSITARSIPLKSSLIDSSKYRYQSGSDIYVSRIVKDYLADEDVVAISQAHRQMREGFMAEPSIKDINAKLKDAAAISEKNITISVDLATKNAWENSLMTYLDDVPFQQIGKGEQTIIKTKLSLSHKKSQEANVILLEEPENHLSHSRLSQLIRYLKQENSGKQVIISTHSSFVANKLGLGNLIFLHNQTTMSFDSLKPSTQAFFEKLAGYDTLRLLLCKKAILVEGDSDELIVQKAYMDQHDNRLPIENNIDVISVGLSFLRFLEIAEQIKQDVAVITDNDGDIEALKKKYEDFVGENAKDKIRIYYDEIIDQCPEIYEDKNFNCNTLEPKLVKVNGLQKMNKVLDKDYKDLNSLHKYMKANKTDCALSVFNTKEKIIYPQYILDAIADE